MVFFSNDKNYQVRFRAELVDDLVREGEMPQEGDLVPAGCLARRTEQGGALGQHRKDLLLEVIQNVVPGNGRG